jgi:hypothetical protein
MNERRQDIHELTLMLPKFLDGRYVGIKLSTIVSAIKNITNSAQHIIATGDGVLRRQ